MSIYPAGAQNVAPPLTGAEIVTLDTGGAVKAQATTAAISGAGPRGTFVANGVTPVTVSNTKITANSTILVTLKTVGGTVGAIPAVQTITPGTGFTIAGTASDTSTYNYQVFN